MNADDYQRFIVDLATWARAASGVVGLVTVGSTAGRSHLPDEWSDHDLFVVTEPGRAAALRADLSWLPGSELIVMVFAETEHGRCIVRNDGHMVELAVLDEDEIDRISLNDHRVLVDRANVTRRVAAIVERTAAASAEADPDGSRRHDMIIKELIVGLGRFGRGEHLSAHQRIAGTAVEQLTGLVRDCLPTEHPELGDNLDPRRRIERTHPDIAARLQTALSADLPTLAGQILVILESDLDGRIGPRREAIAAVRSVLDRVRDGTPRSAMS